MKHFVLGLLASFPVLAMADYCAVDVPVATQCDGLIIKTCNDHYVLYVQDGSKRKRFMPCFSSVTDYYSKTAKCVVRMDNGMSVTGWLVDKVSRPSLYGRPVKGGQVKELDPDYITFECRRK